MCEPLADLSDAAALQLEWGDSPQGLGQLANFVAQKAIPMYGDRVGIFKSVCQSSHLGPCGITVPGVPWDCRACYLSDPGHGWQPVNDHTLADQSPAEQQVVAQELRFFAIAYLERFQLIAGWPPYLVKLVELARAHHIRLAFVVSPLHQLYRDLLTPAQWQAIMTYWSTYAHGAGIAFYDQSQAPQYTDADFRDPHHLNVAGAMKFSAWLATTIVGPQLVTAAHHP